MLLFTALEMFARGDDGLMDGRREPRLSPFPSFAIDSKSFDRGEKKKKRFQISNFRILESKEREEKNDFAYV